LCAHFVEGPPACIIITVRKQKDSSFGIWHLIFVEVASSRDDGIPNPCPTSLVMNYLLLDIFRIS
jgi:hypothetical protein